MYGYGDSGVRELEANENEWDMKVIWEPNQIYIIHLRSLLPHYWFQNQ